MPTRIGVKPSSYTFNASDPVGGDMEGGWIFVSGDVSGSDVTDITGNGRTLALQGTASIGATDATHGDCLTPGDSGAALTPPASWGTNTQYTVIAGVYVITNTNGSGATEYVFALENSSSSQDTLRCGWLASENVSAFFEDADSASTATITDAIINDALKWATIAAVCDGVSGDVSVYVIIDGEATQVDTNSASGISGATINSIFQLGDGQSGAPWHGLVEYGYYFPSAKSQADIEALHVNPYSMLGAPAGQLDITGPDSTTEGASTQMTGAELDTVTTVALQTDDGAFSVAQTIDAQTATTLDYVASSGVFDATPGSPANGIPLEPTVTAAGATPYQIQQLVDV